MRPVVLGDLVALAQVLRGGPPDNWTETLHSMIRRAAIAEDWCLRTSRRHPEWGCGSLYDVAAPAGCTLSDADTTDPVFLRALAAACHVVAEREEANTSIGYHDPHIV